MQPVKALLNEDLVSLAHTPQEARLRLWHELEGVRQGLRALAGALPSEVEARHRGEQALAALRLAASFQTSPSASGLPGVTDTFTPEELELVRGLEECKALDVLEASEVEWLLRRGGSHPVLEKLARGQYERLHALLESTAVRRDVLAGVHQVYRRCLEALEAAAKAYLAYRVDTVGADRAGRADGGGAPIIYHSGGTMIVDNSRIVYESGKKATDGGSDGPGEPGG